MKDKYGNLAICAECKTFPKKNGYYIHYGESDKFVCQPCLLTLIRRNLVPRIEQVELFEVVEA